MRLAALRCLAMGLALVAASAQPAPIASYPIAEARGRVVQAVPGSGMPWLVIDTGEAKIRVRLGPMRYLIENGFSPKAGMTVRVTGYQVDGEMIAILVTLPESGKELRFRDDQGRPLWRGCRHCGRHPE
jgi:hypothetical protein